MSHVRQTPMPWGGEWQVTAWYELERLVSKRAFEYDWCRCAPQWLQSWHGIAVSELPVSTIRSNFFSGVPAHTYAEK